eukprot:11760790-Alexandrium_andersonii.AAC.1
MAVLSAAKAAGLAVDLHRCRGAIVDVVPRSAGVAGRSLAAASRPSAGCCRRPPVPGSSASAGAR